MKVCELCGEGFTPTPWQLLRGNGGRFCSRSCVSRAGAAAKHAAHPQDGANNPHWKGGVSTDHYRYTSRFRRRSPEKLRAQRLLARAIATGRLVRPTSCSACGIECFPHGHHDDYSRPLEVRWLCQPCHLAHHHAERRNRRAA